MQFEKSFGGIENHHQEKKWKERTSGETFSRDRFLGEDSRGPNVRIDVEGGSHVGRDRMLEVRKYLKRIECARRDFWRRSGVRARFGSEGIGF